MTGNTTTIEQLQKQLSDALNENAHLKSEHKRRLGLFWENNPDEVVANIANRIPYLVRRPKEQGVVAIKGKPTHTLIKGDNYEALITLLPKYKGKVNVIYIDPPYNTGNKDFIYNDSFVDKEDSFRHSKWLSFMKPRLELAKQLLADDGVIFVSIDDNEQAYLKVLMDEVFGETNYLNTFVWVNNLKGRQISASGAAGTKEYILCYARRGDDAGEFRSSGSQLKALMPTVYKGFNYTVERDEHGPYVLKNELYNTNSAFNEVTRPNLVFDIYYDPETLAVKTAPVSDAHLHTGFVKISPKRNNNGTNRYHAFRWSTRKVETESHNLAFLETPSGWKVYTKVRDVDSAALKDIVTDITTNEGSKDIERLGIDSKLFDYPKPVSLIKVLVEASSRKDAIVLDFFAGSGTTGQAVAELNAEDGGKRRCILVTDAGKAEAGRADIADEITLTRLRRVLTGEDWADGKEHPNLGQGLDVFDVETTPTQDVLAYDWDDDGNPLNADGEPLTDEDLTPVGKDGLILNLTEGMNPDSDGTPSREAIDLYTAWKTERDAVSSN